MDKLLSLEGKKGLIFGIANEQSIAYGCAKMMHGAGADVLLTYADPGAEPFVQHAVDSLPGVSAMLCDVREDAQLEAVFERVRGDWGQLDFLVHSIAFANKDDLHARVIDCSRDGLALAMDVSCHTFIRMARLAERLMPKGGCLLTMSYCGAEKVVDHFNIMGPVKAALESTARFMAIELGTKKIRVYAISPGPLKTRAASAISHFDDLLEKASAHAPGRQLVTIEDVGSVAACLVSDAAAALTDHVDAGLHIRA